MDPDRQERISRRAYELWEQEGRPEGRSEEFWARAQAEIEGPGTGTAPTDAGPGDEAAPGTPGAGEDVDGKIKGIGGA
jgi:Protein of unknown function (DUF2934)